VASRECVKQALMLTESESSLVSVTLNNQLNNKSKSNFTPQILNHLISHLQYISLNVAAPM